jgi:hypothetical protein
MAQVIIDDTNLTNIANAIRNKNGTNDKYKPSQMARAINAIVGADISDIPDEVLHLTWNCSYFDYAGKWDWFIERYVGRMTTSDVIDTNFMFYDSNLIDIPLDIQGYSNSYATQSEGMYMNATNLETVGAMYNFHSCLTKNMFHRCFRLRYLPTFEGIDYSYANNFIYDEWSTDQFYPDFSQMFFRCYSLRSIPEELMIGAYNGSLTDNEWNKTIFYRTFEDCYALDEIRGIDPRVGSGAITKNLFYNTFNNCWRVKDIIFNTNNGAPYEANLSNQVIDLLNYVGYANGSNINYLVDDYNSGLDNTTRIIASATSYDTLKDNVDSWTSVREYSRYNRTSAVNTINSLPNVSSGTNNIIKFRSMSGQLTDGGAIGTMSEEEVAVAVAKGWTVSYS